LEGRTGKCGAGQGGDVSGDPGQAGGADDGPPPGGSDGRTGDEWGENQTDEDDRRGEEDRGGQLAVLRDEPRPRRRGHSVGVRPCRSGGGDHKGRHRRHRKEQAPRARHYFRLASGTTNSSEWGLALPFLPWGQLVRLKSTQGVPSFWSRNFVSRLSLPPGATSRMQTWWLPSTAVRAAK